VQQNAIVRAVSYSNRAAPSCLSGSGRSRNRSAPAIVASSKPGPLQEFYIALLTKGIRPEMARLTLARKIATIVLIVWKRGVCFDAQHLKPQTLSVFDRVAGCGREEIHADD
jgi:hypothetical protein